MLARLSSSPGSASLEGHGRGRAGSVSLSREDQPPDERATERYVALRGFSWIVEPSDGGVVIAIEIPMGAAVAGPFAIAQPVLDRMISRVMAAAAPHKPVIH